MGHDFVYNQQSLALSVFSDHWWRSSVVEQGTHKPSLKKLDKTGTSLPHMGKVPVLFGCMVCECTFDLGGMDVPHKSE